MADETSVGLWISAMRRGDTSAIAHLWQQYFDKLTCQAKRKMSRLNRSIYDEEDAALSTFRIIYAKLQEGRYGKLSTQNELWQLMATVLQRKIGRRAKYQNATKRRGDFSNAGSIAIEELPAPTMSDFSIDCLDLIASLNDPNLEQVALLRYQGYTNDEIAIKLQRTRRTIQRMLHLIRDIWQESSENE